MSARHRNYVVVPSVLVWMLLLSVSAVPRVAADETENQPILSILIDEALRNNPEIRLMRHRWESAREEVPQASALDDPQFRITRGAIPSKFNVGRANETWYGIEQSFPFPGQLSSRKQIATAESKGVEQAYLAKIREITAHVKAAYYQLHLIQESIHLHLEHQALLEEFIQIAGKKYAIGQVSQQDLIKAQVELSKLHNSLLLLEQEESSTRTALNSLLNRSPETSLGRIAILEYRPLPLTLEELTKQAVELRPDLKSAEYKIEKAEETKALSSKNYLPNLTVEVTYQEIESGPNQWMAAGKINLPWIFRGKYDARVRQAAAEVAEARADGRAVLNRTLFELRDLFTKAKTAEHLIEVYGSGVLPQAEQSLAASRISYQAGKSGFLELIDSERTLLDLQLESVGALVLFWESVARLERVVGAELDF